MKITSFSTDDISPFGKLKSFNGYGEKDDHDKALSWIIKQRKTWKLDLKLGLMQTVLAITE